MRNRGMTENAIFEALKAENAARCHPLLDDSEVHKISRSISRYSPAVSNSGIKGNEQGWQSPLAPLRTVNLADVKVQKVSWLWNPFIALGTFTLIDGEEGIGKSLLTLALGCTVAGGKNIDSTSGFNFVNAEPGNVLLLSAEESISYVIKPRVLAMGGNCERFIAIEELFSFDNDGLLRLEMAIAIHEPKVVFIDPVFSYAGKIRLNDDNDIRKVTNELTRIAAKFNCAIIGIRHIGKSKGNGDAR
ncbi:MAG: AAA family ATPase, partial [Aridibacter sp.]